jgi:hypothetical protein
VLFGVLRLGSLLPKIEGKAHDEKGVVVATPSSKSPAGGQRYKNQASLNGMLGLEMDLAMAGLLRFLC